MRSSQEFIHWLEMGAGARWLRLASVVAVTIALSLLISWKQFRGPATESTLEQADVGRQLARGEGFTTQVNYPQTAAALKARGIRFDPTVPYPELHHAPLYPALIGGALRLLPEATRARLFVVSSEPSDGYPADFFLLGLNLALLWLAAWLTYRLGRDLFDARTGWLAALALLVTLSLWQQTLALNGTPLLMVLALVTFGVWRRVELATTPADEATAEPFEGKHRTPTRFPVVLLAGLGACCGFLFLTEYSAGALVLVALGYAAMRFTGRARWFAVGAVLLGFLLVSGLWMARNVRVVGHPVGLASGNVALKAGDSTAEPFNARATFSADPPELSLRKLGNKTLTSLQENLRTRIWAGGAMWFCAFFVAGWMYGFRSVVANRLRWIFTASLAVLLLAQASLNSGESERLVVVWLAPLMIVFGAGFFFVLLGSNSVLGNWPRAMAAALLVIQALPLVHDALAPPPPVRFQYPPYFPALLRGVRSELESRNALGTFGAMADVPAGLAWYGDVRAWAQPYHLRDFYALTLEQAPGELLLTPRTLDRPFFTDLNAKPVGLGSLVGPVNRFGDWGEVYAGLLTRDMPREFPLSASHRVSENLWVLLNPTMPPPRGK